MRTATLLASMGVYRPMYNLFIPTNTISIVQVLLLRYMYPGKLFTGVIKITMPACLSMLPA